jgi:hypothetical protein
MKKKQVGKGKQKPWFLAIYCVNIIETVSIVLIFELYS